MQTVVCIMWIKVIAETLINNMQNKPQSISQRSLKRKYTGNKASENNKLNEIAENGNIDKYNS